MPLRTEKSFRLPRPGLLSSHVNRSDHEVLLCLSVLVPLHHLMDPWIQAPLVSLDCLASLQTHPYRACLVNREDQGNQFRRSLLSLQLDLYCQVHLSHPVILVGPACLVYLVDPLWALLVLCL